MKCLCGESRVTGYHAFDGAGPLCDICARQDIFAWMSDLNPGEWGILRRRIEDCLRKNPGLLREVAARLIIKKQIAYEDLM
jgi:hypothetical protein